MDLIHFDTALNCTAYFRTLRSSDFYGMEVRIKKLTCGTICFAGSVDFPLNLFGIEASGVSDLPVSVDAKDVAPLLGRPSLTLPGRDASLAHFDALILVALVG